MNPETHHHDDPKLGRLFHEWKVETTLPPRFDEQVWRRIAAGEKSAASPLITFKNSMTQLLLRPSFAFSYLGILLIAGLVSGFWQARATSHRTSETLSARYVQMIDPYQMPPR